VFVIQKKNENIENGEKRYRDRFDIIESILRKTGNGCKKTRIMYGANLSTVQLKKYLDLLVKNGCLIHDEEAQLYRISQKGIDLLDAISEVSRAKEYLEQSTKRVGELINGDKKMPRAKSNAIFPENRGNNF
jgi:predicted transcriptional regulator